jgi:predicted AAA+ superfamily ATPase
MVQRLAYQELTNRLQHTPAVVLVGSRQVGKTTLARSVDVGKSIVYIDLERPSDVAKLSDPELYLSSLGGKLVILDEIQRMPELFPLLRSLIDERRRQGETSAQFLLLGSASSEITRASSETLAGRISYLELSPFTISEVVHDGTDLNTHWFRGGYPDSFLASSDAHAMQWCSDFMTSYVERYMPQVGVEATPLQLRRFCTMLAHQQASTVNLSRIGNSLGIDAKTVARYIDLLEGLFLIRRVPAFAKNIGKRLVKTPKFLWRDSGVLHALLGLPALEHVLSHPICGHSWEAYCIEQIIEALPRDVQHTYYRTHAGAEFDLVLTYPNGDVHAIEIKRSLAPTISRSFIESMTSIGATHATIVIPDGTMYQRTQTIRVQSLRELITSLALHRKR